MQHQSALGLPGCAALLLCCREVDDGSGDVDAGEFCGVCAKLGVQVSLAEAAALFKRAGYDKAMPYQKWAHNLITQPSRQLAQESAGKYTNACIHALQLSCVTLRMHRTNCFHTVHAAKTPSCSAVRATPADIHCLLSCTLCPAVRKGAFIPGQSANFRGKIIYEECRKPVWTPSDWDPRLAERSAELPDARLQLEFVYGYTGALLGCIGAHPFDELH